MPPNWTILTLLGLIALLFALLFLRGRKAMREVARMLRNLEAGRPVRRLLGPYPGPVAGLVEVYNEVGPELQARRERLEADRHLLQIVLEGMSEGVLAVDGRRRVLFANRGALELFGLEEAGVGRLLAEAIRSPDLQRAVETTLDCEAAHEEEIHIPGPRPARGRPITLVLNVRGRRLSGGAGAVIVFRDVTDLRRLERMRQDFVANASHELKTPLAAIQALTETLIDGAVDDPEVNRDFLRRVEEQTHRLNDLIIDMLNLARLDAGQEVFRHGPLALAPFLRACFDNHQGRAIAAGVRLTFHAADLDGRTEVLADEEALRQVVDNLVDNAIKYTPSGGRISLTARSTDDRVVLEVADTGIGIPRDELPRIFERFYRVDKGRGRQAGGTGLGLSIVRHLVQALNGRISVESRVNAGSLFRVDLPRHAGDPAVRQAGG